MAAVAGPRRFGALLKRYRLAAGLTHERLAERATISARAISDLERGVSHRPRAATVTLLAEALRLGPEEQSTFERAARWCPEALQEQDATAPGAGTLPLQLTSFVGRQAETETLHSLLTRGDVRLVTLTGPGGTGKTRLAIHVVEQLGPSFRDGVRYVSLAPVAAPDRIARTIARALGTPDADGPAAIPDLADLLHDREALLLLDNFEHLLDAAPQLTELLRRCPGVTLLVTSRAVLWLSGEHEFPVAPLPLPDRRNLPPLDALARWPAIALFADRARQVRPEFAITDGTAPAVAEICHRLDGLPLAIELAAARMNVLSPWALLARLGTGPSGSALQVLTRGARDLPTRHRTLRATIDWSYSLLTPDEQLLLRHLAVFAGGCTLEAAERVASTESRVASEEPLDSLPAARDSRLDTLASLVDKSLLYRGDGPDGEPRFMMLETIREYALERLRAHGEESAARRQHAAYYLGIVEATGALLFADARRRLRSAGDQDNIEAALRWLVQHG